MDTENEFIRIENRLQDHEPVIISNDRKTFIHHDGQEESPALSRHSCFDQFEPTPAGIIDKESLQLIQILDLHKALDYTQSATGSAVLLRSLIHPSADLGYIRSRQESLREIVSNDSLRESLSDLVSDFSQGENALYKFFNKGLNATFPYHDIKRAKQATANMTRRLESLPGAESNYLKSLIFRLHAYKDSPLDQMMHGSVFMTFNGLKPERETRFFTPKRKFIPRRFTKWIAAGPAIAAAPYIQKATGLGPAVSPWLFTGGLGLTGAYIFYGVFIKPIKDTESFIEPLRKRCIADVAFSRAIDALGMIDELLSFHQFSANSVHATVLPEITDEDFHVFTATGLKNPVAAKEKTDFVPNNISLENARLTFLSGPNSGGKTTVCKSIVHSQMLAQAGAYILANRAKISVADRIRYQAPKFDGLQDDEGRFGTELSRTRDIFYLTTPKSLVILDELAEGTTYEERLEESFGILSDFFAIGNNTILVTHNHSLADRFREKQTGQCLMVEFQQDRPAYRVIPGISRVSHAEKIAKRIGFSPDDRRRYLKENGYI